MKILHLMREINDRSALGIIARQAADPDHEVAVLLLHDAVYVPPTLVRLELYACKDDVTACGLEAPAKLLDYAELIDLIFAAERVVVW
jgi:sulfur transfer complex TusBCD TusB component (DsrH family)